MIQFLIGRKLGMTRVFTDAGRSIPVTVLSVGGNIITALKTKERDGYQAVQIGFGELKRRRRKPLGVSKALAGHFLKNQTPLRKYIKEFLISDSCDSVTPSVGSEILPTTFQIGQKVDVSGISIGKGFAGVIKRHHFSSGPKTHGCSVSHRAPGSTGMNQDPGRVFPGKKMPGHLGSVRRTVQSLEVVRIDETRKLLLIKGSVPGADGSIVYIKSGVKHQSKKVERE